MSTDYGRLARLLKETGKDHHEAFAHVDGEDPGWAEWYAERMHAEFENIVGKSIGAAGLADLLDRFEELQEQEAPDDHWAEYYARKLLAFYIG